MALKRCEKSSQGHWADTRGGERRRTEETGMCNCTMSGACIYDGVSRCHMDWMAIVWIGLAAFISQQQLRSLNSEKGLVGGTVRCTIIKVDE